jgi:hypothetical protein
MPTCKRCRREAADLMTPPSPRAARCSGTDSLECHDWTSTHWAGEARRARASQAESAALNVSLVRQNCLLVSRNTRMEAILRELGVPIPLKGVFDPPSEDTP